MYSTFFYLRSLQRQTSSDLCVGSDRLCGCDFSSSCLVTTVKPTLCGGQLLTE